MGGWFDCGSSCGWHMGFLCCSDDDNTCRPFSRNDVVAIATAIKLKTPFPYICAKHNDVILSVALASKAAAAKFFPIRAFF